MEAGSIYGGEIDKPKEAIHTVVADALSITFDNSIGEDMDNFVERFDRYNDTSARIPFKLGVLNTMTRGGLPGGRTCIVGAATNVGKSLVLCDSAAHNWRSGKNVLYISGEMDEDETLMRIEGNCLDMVVNDIPDLDKDVYVAKMKRLYQNMPGKLKVKTFPMGTTTVAQFDGLLDELKLKDNFVPDIVYVDYLGVFLSVRSFKGSGMYENGKFVSEDLRAFAQKHKLISWRNVANLAGVSLSQAKRMVGEGNGCRQCSGVVVEPASIDSPVPRHLRDCCKGKVKSVGGSRLRSLRPVGEAAVICSVSETS